MSNVTNEEKSFRINEIVSSDVQLHTLLCYFPLDSAEGFEIFEAVESDFLRPFYETILWTKQMSINARTDKNCKFFYVTGINWRG